jgi:hypothetical protein
VLARIADGLPRTLDAEGYRRLLTRAANHLLPLAHPPSDLRHAINSQRDARSSINASRERRHENKIQCREEYDRDHGIPARSQATRVESTTTSTGDTTRGWSRHHNNNSPPRDRHHHHRQEDTCGVLVLTPHLRAIQWPPGCAAMAMTPTPTLHRRLERLQLVLHCQLPISLRQTGAAMGPQIHQAPRG